MIFDFTDAWLLQAVYYSQDKNGSVSLRGLIAYCDYTNHAIITYNEFHNSSQKLISTGLLSCDNGVIYITNELNIWWKNNITAKRKISLAKELKLIEDKLKKSFGNMNLKITEVQITENEFKKAVESYINN